MNCVKGIMTLLVLALCATGTTYGQAAEQTLSLVNQLSGLYKGNLPCDECRIIETELDLTYVSDTSGNYVLRDKYMGKGKTEVLSASRQAGDWKVVKDMEDKKLPTLIVLDYDNPDKSNYYLLKANGDISPLDKEKQPVESPTDCTLKRVKIEVTD